MRAYSHFYLDRGILGGVQILQLRFLQLLISKFKGPVFRQEMFHDHVAGLFILKQNLPTR